MLGKKNKAQFNVHDGQSRSCPKPPSGYGVKGKASVNKGAVRESAAKTPKSLPGRTA